MSFTANDTEWRRYISLDTQSTALHTVTHNKLNIESILIASKVIDKQTGDTHLIYVEYKG